MIRAGAAAMLLLVLGTNDEDQRRTRTLAPPTGVIVREQHVIIRITPLPPSARRTPAASLSPVEWREGRGPRCVPWTRILAAVSPREHSIDFVFRDGQRVRARLERRCPTLDFYRSLYLRPTRDGQLCADRDAIRSRTGGECEIDQFRSLTPSRR